MGGVGGLESGGDGGLGGLGGLEGDLVACREGAPVGEGAVGVGGDGEGASLYVAALAPDVVLDFAEGDGVAEVLAYLVVGGGGVLVGGAAHEGDVLWGELDGAYVDTKDVGEVDLYEGVALDFEVATEGDVFVCAGKAQTDAALEAFVGLPELGGSGGGGCGGGGATCAGAGGEDENEGEGDDMGELSHFL